MTKSDTPLKRIEVVTAFLRRGGKILLLQRSDKVGSFRGKWSGVSGYLERGTALDQALLEISEETGFDAQDLQLVASAVPLEVVVQDRHTVWVVHPFLFELQSASEVKLDWESTDFAWIAPQAISGFDTVPMLTETLNACLAQEHQQHA